MEGNIKIPRKHIFFHFDSGTWHLQKEDPLVPIGFLAQLIRALVDFTVLMEIPSPFQGEFFRKKLHQYFLV